MATHSHPALQSAQQKAVVFPPNLSNQRAIVDKKADAFTEEASRQARLAASSAQAEEDMAFVEALNTSVE